MAAAAASSEQQMQAMSAEAANRQLAQRLFNGKERVVVHHISADVPRHLHQSQSDYCMQQLRSLLPGLANFLLLNKSRSEYALIYVGKKVNHTSRTEAALSGQQYRKEGAFVSAAATLDMKQKLVRYLHHEIWPELVADLTEVAVDDETEDALAAETSIALERRKSMMEASSFQAGSLGAGATGPQHFSFTPTRVPWNVLISEKVVPAADGGAESTRYLKLTVKNIERLHFDVPDASHERARWEERKLYVRVLDSLQTKSSSYEAFAESFRAACVFMLENYGATGIGGDGGPGSSDDFRFDATFTAANNASSNDVFGTATGRRAAVNDNNNNSDADTGPGAAASRYKRGGGGGGGDDDEDDDAGEVNLDAADCDWVGYPVRMNAPPSCALLPEISPAPATAAPPLEDQDEKDGADSEFAGRVRCTFVSREGPWAIPFGKVLATPESSTLDYKSLAYRALEWLRSNSICFCCGFLNAYMRGRLMIGVMELPPAVAAASTSGSGSGSTGGGGSKRHHADAAAASPSAPSLSQQVHSAPELSGKHLDQMVLGVSWSEEEMRFLGASLQQQCAQCIPPVPPEALHVNAIPVILPEFPVLKKAAEAAPACGLVEPIIVLYDTSAAWRDNFRAKNNVIVRSLAARGLGLVHLPNFVLPLESDFSSTPAAESESAAAAAQMASPLDSTATTPASLASGPHQQARPNFTSAFLQAPEFAPWSGASPAMPVTPSSAASGAPPASPGITAMHPPQQPRSVSQYSLLKNLVDPLPSGAATIAFKVIAVREEGAPLLADFAAAYAAAAREQFDDAPGGNEGDGESPAAAASGKQQTLADQRRQRLAGISAVEWQFKPGQWKPYDADVGRAVLDAWASCQPTYSYSARGQAYVVDLVSMNQKNVATGNVRTIRLTAERRFAFSDPATKNIPAGEHSVWITTLLEELDRVSRSRGNRSHMVVAAAGAATPQLHVLDVSVDIRRVDPSSALVAALGAPQSKLKFFTGWPVIPVFDVLLRQTTTIGRDYSLALLVGGTGPGASGATASGVQSPASLLSLAASAGGGGGSDEDRARVVQRLLQERRELQLQQQQQQLQSRISNGNIGVKFSKRARRLLRLDGVPRRIFKFLDAAQQRRCRLVVKSFNEAFETAYGADLISMLAARRQLLPFFSVQPPRAHNAHLLRVLQRHLLRRIQNARQMQAAAQRQQQRREELQQQQQQQYVQHHHHQHHHALLAQAQQSESAAPGGMLPRFPSFHKMPPLASISIPVTPSEGLMFPVPPLSFGAGSPPNNNSNATGPASQLQESGSPTAAASLPPPSMFPLQLCWLLERAGAVPAPFPFISIPIGMHAAHHALRPASHLIPIYLIPEMLVQPSSAFDEGGGAGAFQSLSTGALHVAVVLDTRDGILKTWHPSAPATVKPIVGAAVRRMPQAPSAATTAAQIFAVVFLTAGDTSPGAPAAPAQDAALSASAQLSPVRTGVLGTPAKTPILPTTETRLLQQRNTAAFASFDDVGGITLSVPAGSPPARASAATVPGAWELSTLLMWLQVAVSDPLARLCDATTMTMHNARRGVLPELFGSGSTFAIVSDARDGANCCSMHATHLFTDAICRGGGMDSASHSFELSSPNHSAHAHHGLGGLATFDCALHRLEAEWNCFCGKS